MTVKNVEDIYPLSPMQQGMLFHTLYAPQSGVYCEQLSWIIRGKLNIAAFKQAWQQIVDTHPILRTMFIWESMKEPLQIVRQQATLSWKHYDLRALKPADQETQVQAILEADRERGFELGQAPLMRMHLLQLDNDTYQFVWSFHHILLDGWSIARILKELFTSYQAWCQEQKLPLTEGRPYRDYIAWLQKQDMVEAERFWRGVLKGFTAPTPLPLQQSAEQISEQQAVYAKQQVQLAVEMTDSLRSMARQHQLTLNTLIQASWALLLSKYSGENDVLFGVTSSGRPTSLPGVESMVGLFINTLPMRIKIAPQDSLLHYCKSIQEQQVAATQYEYCPLVRIQGWSEVQAGQPLFESILVFENYPTSIAPQDFPVDLEISHGSAFEQTNYPLTVVIDPRSSLRLQITYDTSRFEASTIARVLEHWQEGLRGFLSNPHQPIASLSFLTEQERRQLLQEWNATRQEYAQQRCLHELFEEQVERTPEAIALLYEQEHLSYAALNQRANQLAHTLQERGVGPEVRVGLCLERSPELVIGLLGVLKAGGAYVPLDPEYPQERLAYMLTDAQMRCVLTRRPIWSRLAEVELSTVEMLCVEECAQEWEQCRASNPRVGVKAQNLAYVIYTSGSTGRPKGVAIAEEGLVNYVQWCLQAYQGQAGRSVPVHSSLNFDLTITSLLPPLVAGQQVDLLRENQALDQLGTALREGYSFSLLKITPAHLDFLSQWLSPLEGTVSIGTCIIGGEALYGKQLAFWRAHAPSTRFINEYGPTETVVGCCVYEVPGEEINPGPIPIGRPIANTRAYVLDAQGHLQPVGVPGELCIGGVGLARGYLNRPELTAEKFVPDPFSGQPGARLYRTGDRARWRGEGTLEFLGRLDQQIKLRGYRIEPGEIESVLLQHPLVKEAAVTLHSTKRLIAYIVNDSSALDTQEDSSLAALSGKQVLDWQVVFDQSYDQPLSSQADEMFNLAGWNSSYTGLPIPSQEMAEWVDHTIEEILSFHPRSVLEIGCGTGLLLLRIAPHCVYYYGTDFSRAALSHVQRQVQRNELGDGQVVLTQRNADDFSGMDGKAFDLIVLNSVIQYFPNINYLITVLSSALESIASAGRIFIGDVRSLPLSKAFYTSLELHKAAPALSIEQLQQRIHRRADQEKELLIDPRFFYALQRQFPSIRAVDLRPKRGRYHNELTCFRYDVVLHIGPAESPVKTLSWLDWRQDRFSIAMIRQFLLEHEPEYLALSHVANRRLLAENRMLALLENGDRPETVGDLRYRLGEEPEENDALEPEDLWMLSTELPYSVEINWASAREDGSYEVVFRRQQVGSEGIISPEPIAWLTQDTATLPSWEAYANDPLYDRLTRHLLSELRSYVQTKLPAYMVPSGFVILEAMPLTHNGKVDYNALPLPEGSSYAESKAPYVSPQTEMEQLLVTIWKEVLQVDEIGIHDNFFEIGGHSLLMVQMYSRVRETVEKEISMVDLFKYPTVHALAQYLSHENRDEPVLQQSHERASVRREAMKRQQQNRQKYRATLPTQ